jgi:hypothetical protein
MKTKLLSGTCAAMTFGLAAGLFAQSSQTPQSTAPQKISVTGCIQRAEGGSTGTSGTTGATPSASKSETKFALTNATMSTSAGTSGTAGTAGTAQPSTSVASEYRLDAADAKLTPHVGHKVEISGTVEQPSSTATQPPAASAANAPKLKVDNVKMISSTCP